MGTENFDKNTAQPCMKHGEQMAHDFLATPTRNQKDKYPSTAAAQQEHPNGNEQIILKKKSSGMLGEVSCSGKAKFETEKAKDFAKGGASGQNTSTRYMGKGKGKC